jgi:hypothetical protein
MLLKTTIVRGGCLLLQRSSTYLDDLLLNLDMIETLPAVHMSGMFGIVLGLVPNAQSEHLTTPFSSVLHLL